MHKVFYFLQKKENFGHKSDCSQSKIFANKIDTLMYFPLLLLYDKGKAFKDDFLIAPKCSYCIHNRCYSLHHTTANATKYSSLQVVRISNSYYPLINNWLYCAIRHRSRYVSLQWSLTLLGRCGCYDGPSISRLPVALDLAWWRLGGSHHNWQFHMKRASAKQCHNFKTDITMCVSIRFVFNFSSLSTNCVAMKFGCYSRKQYFISSDH